MKRVKQLFAALTLLLPLAGCVDQDSVPSASPTSDAASSEAPVTEVRDTLRMAMSTDPDGLDPHMTTSASTFQITNNIYEPLVTVDTEGNIIPALADSYEPAEDGMSITFHLREGAVFSNGNLADANAVKASFERLMSPDSARSTDYANISNIEVVDDTTITFSFATLDVSALSSFAYPWSAIVDVTVADSLKTDPVGTGPYVLDEWVPQQTLKLSANPDYPNQPSIAHVEFITMPDATSQISAFQNGELDIISVSADQIDTFIDNPDYTVLQSAGNSLQLMAMNLDNEALSDLRVRQAINMAVDKDALIDTVWWGYGEKIGSHYPIVMKEYIDCNDLYPYDPEGAKALLEEAGYGDGLTLEMYLPKNYQMYVNAGQVIADSLDQVGITCNIHIIEWAEWLSDVYNGRNYDLTVVGHTGRLDPYVWLARYASDSAENYFNYSNERVDQLLSEYRTTTDEALRTQMIQDIQMILAEEVPAYYIQDPISLYVMDSSVTGFETYPIDIFELKNISFAE